MTFGRGCAGPRVTARRLRSSLLVLLAVGLTAGCTIALAPPRQPISAPARQAIYLLIPRWKSVTVLRTLVDISALRGGQHQRADRRFAARRLAVSASRRSHPSATFIIAVVHEGLSPPSARRPTRRQSAMRPGDDGALLGLPLEPRDLVAVVPDTRCRPTTCAWARFCRPRAGTVALAGGPSRAANLDGLSSGASASCRSSVAGGGDVTYQRDDGAADRLRRERRRALRHRNGALSQPHHRGRTQCESLRLTLPKDAKTQPIR